MTQLVFSKVLGTQIPEAFSQETHTPSQERLEILKNSSPGVLITAFMEHLGYPLFPEPGQPKRALPIGANNEVCQSPAEVATVFLVEKSTPISPYQDMGLILASLEEFRPHMAPIPDSNLFIFTVDGFQFESSLPESSLILQLYYGLSPTLKRNKDDNFSNMAHPTPPMAQ